MPDGKTWRLAMTNPKTGQRIFRQGRTEGAMRIVRDQMKREWAAGKSTATNEKRTVAEFMAEWLDDLSEQSKAGKYSGITVQNYEGHFKNWFLSSNLGKIRLDRLNTHDVTAFLETLRESTDLTGSSIHSLFSVLKAALTWAVKHGYVPVNVTKQMDAPTKSKSKAKAMHPDDVMRMLKVAGRGSAERKDSAHFNPLKRFEAMFALASLMGMRRGEVLGLKWEQVNFIDNTIRVEESLRRLKDEGLVLGKPKSAKSKRTIPMPLNVANILAERRRIQDGEREAAGDLWVETGFVMAGRRGRPLQPSETSTRMVELLEAAGLPAFRFHDLRHSCASLLYRKGVDLKMIQVILGHSRLATTAEIYTHIDVAQTSVAMSVIDQYFEPTEAAIFSTRNVSKTVEVAKSSSIN
jgi:integrase